MSIDAPRLVSRPRATRIDRRRLDRPWTSVALGRAARTWVTLLLVLWLQGLNVAHAQVAQMARVHLSADPLFATHTVDKATISLALSVEWPTAGAQYVGDNWPDDSYRPSNEYLGYFDTESCYSYRNTPTETVAPGKTLADYKRFVRASPAQQRRCDGTGGSSDGFSGNYLNWAASSAIDMLRLALSGGDRSIDTPSLTMLQRAMVPNGDPACLWLSWNFPQKKLTAENGKYWGAVPAVMRNAAQAANSPIIAANTLNRLYFGLTPTGNCNQTSQYTLGNTLNSDGFFYVRVEVCSRNGTTLLDVRDYGLCKQYPDGNYKPIGAIQKYSDQLRLAAFGYVMDQTSARYGGVLRAPMKYVGPKTYDIYGRDNTPTTGNPKLEWNINNGVLYDNPDQHAMGISGVINYLNRLGRTGPVWGRYKELDAISELYYQSLRYLQGLPPSPEAVSGITAEMLDGFPAYTSWPEDPYGNGRSDQANYACLRSNIVVIGDAHSHEGWWRTLPDSDQSASNVPHFRHWMNVVKAFEQGSTLGYIDGQGVARTTSNPNTANPNFPGTEAQQLAAYAYWAHTHDIRGTAWTANAGNRRRPGLRVKTYVFDVNENGTMNDAATRRYHNPLFLTAKYGGFETHAANSQQRPYNSWGNPFRRQDGTADNNVWQKPDAPGEAATYYLQSSGRAVLQAFDEIFARTSNTARSIAGSATTGHQVSATLSPITYSASFDTSNWSGDVVAETTTLNTSTQTLQTGQQLWSAAAQLQAMPNPQSQRNIWIGSGQRASMPTAWRFQWSQLSARQQTDLSQLNPSVNADAYGAARVDYLRGDRSREGNPFRIRSSLLGDIVHANVVLSGKPSTAHSGASYQAFRSSFDQRTHAVFAGANDGMLHAFHAQTGQELFAYIPSWLSPKLAALTDPNYFANHQSYVDAPMVAGEVQVATQGNAADWKTVLVGGTGGGGAGVFALDISNPSVFNASHVLWEFTRSDDADLGQVIGQPQLIKLKTSGSAVPATYRWFAAIASGVNNHIPDAPGGPFSSTGQPALFLLALDKPAQAAWVQGSNYYKISFPVDSALAASRAPGMANFAALYGPQGQVTDLYAGDLHGNLWKLSFRNLLPADWHLNKLSFFNKGTAATPKPYPMFIARDSAGQVQAITAAPTLFTGPVVSGVETYYVALGTGKYLESEDQSNTQRQSVYVLYDNGASTGDATATSEGAIAGRSRLRAATVNTTQRTISVPSFQWGRAPAGASSPIRSGFYIDLPTAGERLVSAIVSVAGSHAAFNTIVPSASQAVPGSCTQAQSTGLSYQIQITSGVGQWHNAQLGALGAPVYMQVLQHHTHTTSVTDSTGRRLQTTAWQGWSDGQSGKGGTDAITPQHKVLGRLSWRQIDGYRDLRSTAP